MSKPTKKFINSPNTAVDDFIQGLIVSHAHDLTLHPTNHRVILRKEYKEVVQEGKVALISGGGSGHEPFAAGM